jgi:hypothetical protein
MILKVVIKNKKTIFLGYFYTLFTYKIELSNLFLGVSIMKKSFKLTISIATLLSIYSCSSTNISDMPFPNKNNNYHSNNTGTITSSFYLKNTTYTFSTKSSESNNQTFPLGISSLTLKLFSIDQNKYVDIKNINKNNQTVTFKTNTGNYRLDGLLYKGENEIVGSGKSEVVYIEKGKSSHVNLDITLDTSKFPELSDDNSNNYDEQPDEADKLAEQQRLQDEADRLAEQQRLQDEADRLAEQQRLQDEADRLAEQQRLQDEADRLAEQQRLQDEADRLAEQQRLQDEADRLAEQQRLQDEADRLAEQQRIQDEADKLAEQQRIQDEADRLAEQQRLQDEADRLAEQQRLQDEADRLNNPTLNIINSTSSANNTVNGWTVKIASSIKKVSNKYLEVTFSKFGGVFSEKGTASLVINGNVVKTVTYQAGDSQPTISFDLTSLGTSRGTFNLSIILKTSSGATLNANSNPLTFSYN